VRYALRSKVEFVEFEPFVSRWVWAPKTTFVMLDAFVCDAFMVQLHKYRIPLAGSQCMPRGREGGVGREQEGARASGEKKKRKRNELNGMRTSFVSHVDTFVSHVDALVSHVDTLVSHVDTLVSHVDTLVSHVNT
jgi:hypothetical protein